MTRYRTGLLLLTSIGMLAIIAIAIRFWTGATRVEEQSGKVEPSIVNVALTDAGLALAYKSTGQVDDPASLDDLRKAIEQRGPAALEKLEARMRRLEAANRQNSIEMARAWFQLGTLHMYQGSLSQAREAFRKAQAVGEKGGMAEAELVHLTVLLGVIALRRGEVENCIGCVGPSSCILPIAGEAIHKQQEGSREAIEQITKALEKLPGDLRLYWVLNIAAMTLGEYPEGVPAEFRVPIDTFDSKIDVGKFENIAPRVGLTSRGPNQAGGSVFDDFTGDGLPDLFVTSLDADRGAALFVNRGDGTFEDQSEAAGLNDQVYALNVSRADFDNDGNLDVVLLRGGWEKSLRMSLLRNKGHGRFEDVTIASGLGDPIASEVAVWGDYDNDGQIDLFVGGEYRAPFSRADSLPSDPQSRCRLYRNQGGGEFVNVAKNAGVNEEQCTKGAAWGDYDDDGFLDLYASSMNAPCRLYHNERNGTFRDVAGELEVAGPRNPFACWFWDYDNDGRLDLYVNDYSSSLAKFVAGNLRLPVKDWSAPRLYRNLGAAGFEDVAAEVGLYRGMLPMGSNFGDIDNDGYLDIYLGTGQMDIEALVPNLMFRNDTGKRFDDITLSSGTGHLQKGHGISFADWDCDGDLDLFVEAGGAVPGDRAYNVLFRNPGHGRHWLKVKLVGTKTNRAAIGARIKATIRGDNGELRSIYRTIGNNGSFGGNSLVESIGLSSSTRVAELEVHWPTSGSIQKFQDVEADQAIEITEGLDTIQSYPQPWSS